jgi:hypothetical protein
MSEEMKFGMLMAYQAVEEKIETIKAELSRKGIDVPKGFSVLEGFVDDSIKQLRDDNYLNIIGEQPTAYDVDAVVQEIIDEVREEMCDDYCKYSAETDTDDGTCGHYDDCPLHKLG